MEAWRKAAAVVERSATTLALTELAFSWKRPSERGAASVSVVSAALAVSQSRRWAIRRPVATRWAVADGILDAEFALSRRDVDDDVAAARGQDLDWGLSGRAAEPVDREMRLAVEVAALELPMHSVDPLPPPSGSWSSDFVRRVWCENSADPKLLTVQIFCSSVRRR